jgi:ribosomal protein S18 acetylase RimI-like enzyme
MTETIRIQRLPATDVGRLAEIDRSEQVRVGYTYRDGGLRAEEVDWRVPPWSAEGDGPHSLPTIIRFCAEHLEAGGVLLGALDGDRLAGVVLLRYRLTESMAQLAFLHVSREYRRQGIAAQLTEEMVRLARLDGARELYVSAQNPNLRWGSTSARGSGPQARPTPRSLPSSRKTSI